MTRDLYYGADARKKHQAGMDVSTHQKDVEWAADGIDFVMLRLGHRCCTDGGLFLDQAFEQSLQGTLDAVPDFYYHFNLWPYAETGRLMDRRWFPAPHSAWNR